MPYDEPKRLSLDLPNVIIRPHPIVKIFDYLTINFFWVITFVLIWVFSVIAGIDFSMKELMPIVIGGAISLFFFQSVVIVAAIISWMNTYYVLTRDTIIYTTGVLSKDRKVYVLRNVIEINLHQDLLGKIFNYGTIALEAHLIEDTVYIRDVISPQRQVNILNKVAQFTKQLIPVSADARRPFG